MDLMIMIMIARSWGTGNLRTTYQIRSFLWRGTLMTWETLQVEYYIHIKQSSDLSMVLKVIQF